MPSTETQKRSKKQVLSDFDSKTVILQRHILSACASTNARQAAKPLPDGF
jgi:hypothetical protein